MRLDATTTRTGLLLGVASALLAITTLTIETRKVAPPPLPEPEVICGLRAFDPEPPPPPSRVPDACRQYIDAIRTLSQTCDGLPVEAQDQLLAAALAAERAWQDLPESSYPTLAEACAQATDAVHQSIKQVCPIRSSPR